MQLMLKQWTPVAVAACAVCASASALAQTTLDPVVVTATRIEMPLSEVLSDLTLIEGSRLVGTGATTLGERLQTLPGIESSATGDKIFIRGAEARMTAVYIDGIRVDRQDGYVTGGGAPWSLISAGQMERIEILQGASSSQYGSDGMGGVVQLFAYDGRDGDKSSLTTGIGSRADRFVNLIKAGQVDRIDYSFGLGRHTNAGYNTKPDIAHTPETENWARTHMNANIGLQLNPAQHLAFKTIQNTSMDKEVPWNGGDDMTTKGQLAAYSLKLTSVWSDQWQSKIQWSDSKTHFRQPNASTQVDDKNHYTKLTSFRIDNQFALSQGQQVTLGVEHINDTFTAAADDWYNPAQGGSRKQMGVNVGWGVRLGEQSVYLSARHDDITGFDPKLTYGINYGIHLSPALQLTMGVSSGYRAPNLSQVYDPNYGDPSLRPETSKGVEARLSYRADGVAMHATVYQSKYVDLISANSSFVWYNVGRARVKGINLSGTKAWGAAKFGASFDYTDAINSDSMKRLNYRSPRKWSAFAEMPMADWQTRLELLAKSARWDDASNTRWLSGFGLLNIELKKAVSSNSELTLRADNVFDRDVEEVSGLASPGRRLLATMNWDW